MNRQEAETEIRSVSRVCRGPRRATTAAVVALLATVIAQDRKAHEGFAGHPENDPADAPPSRVGDMMHVAPAQDEALGEEAESLAYVTEDHRSPWFTDEYRATLEACASAVDVSTKLLEDGHDRAAHFVDVAARTRGCGADFNDIVCAGPLDGELHDYTCPKCGVTGSYTAPLYEG